MSIDHDQLIEERNEQYGEAWKKTSRWIGENSGWLAALEDESFCVVMIHNKIMRAERSPENRDHLDDIIGYAKLALTCKMDESRRFQYRSIIQMAQRGLALLEEMQCRQSIQ